MTSYPPTEPQQPAPSTPRLAPAVQFRVWHLALLVLFVAVAIKNIQDQRRNEPALIVLAASGFVLYGVLGWLAWQFLRRFEGRVGALTLLIIFIVGMAVLFVVATAVYLVIEYGYIVRWIRF